VKRELSTELLALIADSLMVASALLCWRWASRYSSTVEKHLPRVRTLESKQNPFEHRIVNMPAFLMWHYAQMKRRHFEKVLAIPTDRGGDEK
jgi:hypothetical protein